MTQDNSTLKDKIIHKEIDTGVFSQIIEDNKLDTKEVKFHIDRVKERLKEKYCRCYIRNDDENSLCEQCKFINESFEEVDL